MKRNILFWGILSWALAGALLTESCKHDPTFVEITDPVDTTGNPVDTVAEGTPCDPNKVYFELQILPILVSNCAMSGCHNEASHQDGVVLTTYQKVMQTAEVRPFDLGDSELYEVITDNDPDKRMPPPPSARLSTEQIALIASWINQGAQNLTCDPDAGGCNTSNVTYSGKVRPLLQSSCVGCHSGSAPGGGINLSTHAGVAAVAANGRLYGAINHQSGFVAMPLGGQKLSTCNISQIKAWIDAGAPNN